MYRQSLALGFLTFAACCAYPAGGWSADKAEAAGVTIEFQDTASRPDVTYAVKMVVEFADGRKPVAVTMHPPAGSSGTQLCNAISGHLTAQKGWEQARTDNKLVISSWKDPKTGTVHAVKNITFTSDDMPKAEVPKVMLPGRKG